MIVSAIIDKKNLDKAILKIDHHPPEDIIGDVDWTDENIKREKGFILERINERKDEKLKYGVQRAEELLCKDEPFGVFLYGDQDNVQNVDKDVLKNAYSELLKSCVTVIISGNLEGYDNIEETFNEVFKNIEFSSKEVTDLIYNTKRESDNKTEEVK